MDSNERLLKTVKGLGAKTAQRIIIELKDKVATLGIEATTSSNQQHTPDITNSEVYSEAVDALKMLGFPPAPSVKAVKTVLKDNPAAPVEKVIKKALQIL